MKLSYTHPKLPIQKIWLSGKREGAPIILDPYMHVWGHKKIKKYYRFKLDYKDGYWFYFGNMTEFKLNIRLFGYTVLEYFLDKVKFSNYLKKWNIVKKETLRLWNDFPLTKIKKISDKELVNLIKDSQTLLIDIWGISPLAAMIGDMATDWTNWWLDSKGLSEEEKKKAFHLLFFTKRKTETIKRQEAIKKLFIKDKGNKNIFDFIIRKYGYAKSNFGGFHQYTKEDILHDIDSISKIKITDHSLQKKTLLKKLGANPVEKRIFDIFGYCQYSRDERMAYEQRLFAIIDWSIMEISERFDVSHKLLKYMLIGEIDLKNIKNKNYINLLKKRNKGFIMYWKDGKKGKYVVGKDAYKIFSSVDNIKLENTQELKGQPAFYGHVRGRVRVIMNPKAEKPQEPFVLVTSMTSPDFVHFLHKCVAIITDEGGITCHAAILSRELKKPCIIGTKIATKILKDGDFVEVDADKGIVKILKKAK